jgi:maltokinase
VTDLDGLSTPDAFDRLAVILREWVPQQRWFAGKARDFADLQLVDAILLTGAGEPTPVFLLITEVVYDDGHIEHYQVPLVPGTADGDGYVGEVEGIGMVDATYAPGAARVMASLAYEQTERRTARGDILVGTPVEPAELPDAPPRRIDAEQSNTSMVLGDSAILKIFRRLEPGENPDVEITRALTESGFANAPHQRGSFGLRHSNGLTTALGVLSAFVPNAQEGWAVAVAEVQRVTAGEGEPALLGSLKDLGRAVAEMHGALARTLGAQEATPGDLQHWVAAMRQQALTVLATAMRRAPDAAAAVLERANEINERLERLATEKATGPLTRTHGDLHLGQVLLDAQGTWQLLYFEGEPSKPLEARRALHPPLRDVAGMLRSFDYAAAAGSGGDLAQVPAAAEQWRDAAREAFLDGYLDTGSRSDVLPHDQAAIQAQLDAFELDKAVYELGYELANRPDWVPIPVGGILRVLDRATSNPS